MDKTENNLAKRLPSINDHNSFAKIIKNLFHDDFIFSKAGWYERINGGKQSPGQSPSEAGVGGPRQSPGQSPSEAGAGDPAWQVISSCRFKNIVFKRDGAFEKYLRKHIEKSANYEDFEEFGRTISIYKSILLNKVTSKLRSYIEKESRLVFLREKFQMKLKIINVFTIRENTAAKIVVAHKGVSIIRENITANCVDNLCPALLK